MSFTDDKIAKHKSFEAEKLQQKLDEQKLRESIHPLAKNEKPKPDEYQMPATCTNCKYEGAMAVKKGIDVSSAHKIIHAKRCPECGCEAFALPGPLDRTKPTIENVRFHLNNAEARRDIYKITLNPDDRRRARSHVIAAELLLDILNQKAT